MKIFVVGATGAIGSRLVPLLVSRGHQVVATTRTPGKTPQLREQGADPIILDGLDRDAVYRAVTAARPDVIVHQMTSLASMRSLKHFDREFALTNRLRTEGTEFLIAAARAAVTPKLIVQSYAGWPSAREGGRIKTEEDPFDPNPPKSMAESLAAIRKLESLVSHLSGIDGFVLRYGSLYGPGTSTAPGGEIVNLVVQRRFPIIGDGAGIWSFLHVDDAAGAALRAIDSDAPGIYNIVDDEPAEVSIWLPELAKAVGAKPPRHLPAWLGKLAMGDAGLSMMTRIRGASNAKAKRLLGWKLAFPSWRQGFSTFGGQAPAPVQSSQHTDAA